MNAVTQGIDAIASTRVLIRGENGHTSTHALTGETVHRTFRYEMNQPCLLHLFFFTSFSDRTLGTWRERKVGMQVLTQ